MWIRAAESSQHYEGRGWQADSGKPNTINFFSPSKTYWIWITMTLLAVARNNL